MYFHKSIIALNRSFALIKANPVFLLMGLVLALFGGISPVFEFFRLHTLSHILSFSSQVKVIYVLWQVISWLLSLIIGSFLIPLFILMVNDREVKKGKKMQKNIMNQAKDISYRFVVLLFVYDNLAFILSGGGFLVAIAALINNVFYQNDIITVYDVAKNTPFVATGITVALVLATFLSLIFIITAQIMVFENKGVINSIIEGFRYMGKELSFILTAWVVLNLCTLIPLIGLSIIIYVFFMIATQIPNITLFYIALGVFLSFYTGIVTVGTVFWTEVYLNTKGKVSLSTLMDRQ